MLYNIEQRMKKKHFLIHHGRKHVFIRIFEGKNPASLRLSAAEGLLIYFKKECVSPTLSSASSWLNPLLF